MHGRKQKCKGIGRYVQFNYFDFGSGDYCQGCRDGGAFRISMGIYNIGYMYMFQHYPATVPEYCNRIYYKFYRIIRNKGYNK